MQKQLIMLFIYSHEKAVSYTTLITLPSCYSIKWPEPETTASHTNTNPWSNENTQIIFLSVSTYEHKADNTKAKN